METMSGLLRFLAYSVILIMALVALTYGLCVAFAPSYPRLTLVKISLVPMEQIPIDIFGRPPEGPALRIDFRSRPPLLREGAAPFLQVRFCDDKKNPWWEIWGGQVYVEDKPLAQASPPLDSPIIYSGYFPVSRISRSEFRAENTPDYDLKQRPLPLCIWADYGTDAFNSRRTNTIRVEAEQVAATLR